MTSSVIIKVQTVWVIVSASVFPSTETVNQSTGACDKICQRWTPRCPDTASCSNSRDRSTSATVEFLPHAWIRTQPILDDTSWEMFCLEKFNHPKKTGKCHFLLRRMYIYIHIFHEPFPKWTNWGSWPMTTLFNTQSFVTAKDGNSVTNWSLPGPHELQRFALHSCQPPPRGQWWKCWKYPWFDANTRPQFQLLVDHLPLMS